MSLAESRVRVAVKTSSQLFFAAPLAVHQRMAKSPIRRQIDALQSALAKVAASCTVLWIRHAATGAVRFSGTVPSGTQVITVRMTGTCATGRTSRADHFRGLADFLQAGAPDVAECVKRTMPVCDRLRAETFPVPIGPADVAFSGGNGASNRGKNSPRTPAEIGTFEIPT